VLFNTCAKSMQTISTPLVGHGFAISQDGVRRPSQELWRAVRTPARFPRRREETTETNHMADSRGRVGSHKCKPSLSLESAISLFHSQDVVRKPKQQLHRTVGRLRRSPRRRSEATPETNHFTDLWCRDSSHICERIVHLKSAMCFVFQSQDVVRMRRQRQQSPRARLQSPRARLQSPRARLLNQHRRLLGRLIRDPKHVPIPSVGPSSHSVYVGAWAKVNP
jgi:hypothetical protein